MFKINLNLPIFGIKNLSLGIYIPLLMVALVTRCKFLKYNVSVNISQVISISSWLLNLSVTFD